MPCALKLSIQFAAIVQLLTLGGAAPAQTVWSGFGFNFTRPNDVDPTQPANQDRITPNVWITRNVQSGIFNFAEEVAYLPTSPADTAWATNINNPSDTIAATNWANLDFDPWIDVYGGMGSMALPAFLTSRNAVLHLITDNIYLDIQFTSWTSNAGGGGFSYNRSAAPPGPTTTGDYNLNDVVDAADYVLWRDTFGQAAVPPGSGADGDLSGMIDDPDYDFWAAHYGEVIPAAASTAVSRAVPEPSAVVLLLAGTGLLVLRRRAVPFGPRRVPCTGRIS